LNKAERRKRSKGRLAGEQPKEPSHNPNATQGELCRRGAFFKSFQGRNCVNLIVGWVGADDFFFFVVPRQFSPQDIGEWPENQILIPHWTYFHCPGTTLEKQEKDYNGHQICSMARNNLAFLTDTHKS